MFQSTTDEPTSTGRRSCRLLLLMLALATLAAYLTPSGGWAALLPFLVLPAWFHAHLALRDSARAGTEAMRRARDGEARLALAMEVTALGLWDYREDEECVGANDQAALMLGYAPEDFVETRAAFVARLHPDDRERVRACFRAYREGARPDYRCEFRMRTREGDYRWFRSVGRIVERDAAGAPRRILGTYLDITEHVALVERLEAMSVRLVKAQEDERRRLARELHDEIGQQLTALGLNLRALERDVGGREHARLRDAQHIVGESLAAISARVLDLRPTLLDDIGLVAALDDYCRRQEERAGVCITLDAGPDAEGLPEEVRITVFRLIQEAVNNAIRHADAGWINVSVQRHDTELEISVEDDGRGFDPNTPREGRVGLDAMRERCALVGGALHIDSVEGEGTSLKARLPLVGKGSS